MRILPLLFYIQEKPIHERFELTRQVSSITHAHIRSVLACFIYLEYARYLLQGQGKFEAYKSIQLALPSIFEELQIPADEVQVFDRILKKNIQELPEDEIQSSGYVLHTLEASFWCLLQTDKYADAVLKAVNLCKDTDTTAAVVGGLAGLIYGWGNIPANWLSQTLKVPEIIDLAERMSQKIEIN
jgi:ADP-ribosylglycohydrolase